MTYFTPLRRNVGIVALVLACSFASLWLRGYTVGDDFSFGSGIGTQFHSLRVCRSGFNWLKTSSNSSMNWITGWNLSGIGSEDLADPLRGHVLEQTYDWGWRCCGFDFGHAHDDRGTQTSFWMIPYWSIVLPLTLLSAWLLLRPPRSPNSRPTRWERPAQ